MEFGADAEAVGRAKTENMLWKTKLREETMRTLLQSVNGLWASNRQMKGNLNRFWDFLPLIGDLRNLTPGKTPFFDCLRDGMWHLIIFFRTIRNS